MFTWKRKNNMRYGNYTKRSFNWDQPEICSFSRLEIRQRTSEQRNWKIFYLLKIYFYSLFWGICPRITSMTVNVSNWMTTYDGAHCDDYFERSNGVLAPSVHKLCHINWKECPFQLWIHPILERVIYHLGAANLPAIQSHFCSSLFKAIYKW